ncbi:MAG: hypothetical protein SFU99_16255 [Saprospiraceae bacterium]|nr:hypothetical protein [Saprospiraceae bacterium]
MRSLTIFASLILLFCAACQKEETATLKAGNCSNCINFNSLEVGQQSRYIAFKGNRDFEEQKWQYESDTLVVRVSAKTGDNFTFEEYLTTDPDSVRSYNVILVDDSAKIELREYWNGSWLFQGGLLINLPLAPANYQLAEIKGWEAIVTCETAPCYGYLPAYQQQEFIYNDLYVYRNYEPMAWDGNGFFAIYNAKYGVVRSVSVGSWIPVGNGWDLIIE